MNKLGQTLASFILMMIFFSFTSVFIHTAFNLVFIPLQEIIIYLHATIFMLGIVYTHHHDKHVRIDVFYQHYQPSKQRKVNLIGMLFLLLPVFIFMFYVSYAYVISSWQKFETSAEAGGLPFVYGLKTLLLVLPVLMIGYSVNKLKSKFKFRLIRKT